MNKIIIGAIISLMVAILAGLIVYNVTSKPEKGEVLNFWHDNPTVFSKDSSSLAIQRVIFTNGGSLSASDINLDIEYPNYVVIKDVTVSSSIGKNATFKQTYLKNSSYKLECNKLMPGERIVISYLLKSTYFKFNPTIYLKSSQSIGTYTDLLVPKQSSLSKILSVFLPILFCAQLLLLVFVFMRKHFSSIRSLNNTGFLFLHKNLPVYAKNIFENAINGRGGDSFIIGNYAVVKEILGDQDDSVKLIEAALFYSMGFHERAVCEFNYSLIFFLRNEKQNGRLRLKEALGHSKKAIKKYIKFSDLVKKIRADAEIDGIFNELLKEQ